MRMPTEVLREEHALILGALEVLERAADETAGGRALPDSWWHDMLGWLQSFADRTHHGKEEGSLFPALVKAGVPSAGGPVGVMLGEHVEGRALIAAMAEGEPSRRAVTAWKYVELLRQHIDKENDVLFPLADAVLDAPALAAVQRDFDRVEAELGVPGTIAHAAAALARLRASLGA